MKLLIIGFDGLDYNILKEYIDNKEFKLYKMKSLYQVTPADWTTIYTGLKRDIHGIGSSWIEFLKGKFKIMHQKCFWNILNEYNYTTELFNLPCTYPPHEVNGFFISGFPLPFKENGFYYPESLGNKIPADYFNHSDMVHWESLEINGNPKGNWMDWFRNLQYKEVKKKIDEDNKFLVNTYLKLHSRLSHLGFLQFSFIDRIGHCFNNHIEENYDEVVKIINRLDDYIEPENTIIISDHGFQQGGYHTPFSVFATTNKNIKPPADNTSIFNIVMKLFNIPSFRDHKLDQTIKQKKTQLRNIMTKQQKTRSDINVLKNDITLKIIIRDKKGNVKEEVIEHGSYCK